MWGTYQDGWSMKGALAFHVKKINGKAMRASLCLLALTCWLSDCEAQRLRVMTFNIWNSGSHVENGLRKIAKHILLVDPDIVGLQEVQRPDVLPDLLRWMGKPWTGVAGDEFYPDIAILTKHE
ncbi:hypothetical protein TELCIR_09255, partial [Teladorsagia circumcincta]